MSNVDFSTLTSIAIFVILNSIYAITDIAGSAASLNCKCTIFFTFRYIIITSYVYEIPKDCIKEYVKLDLRLNPYPFDHVRCLISPKYELTGISNSSELSDLNRQCWDYNGTYVWLQRMYCCGQACYCYTNSSFIQLNSSAPSFIRKPNNGTVVGYYDHLLAVNHYNTGLFGHYVSDVLIPLLMFPKDIVERSNLIFLSKVKKYQNYLNFIGINPNKAVFLKKREWVYAENLYTPVDPLVHVSHYGQLSNGFARKLREYLKLNEIIPNKYFVTNRGPHQSRHISNMDEIYEAIRERYPERKFSILNDIFNFTEASYVWGSAKLIFGPTGSNLFKHYAMANKSVLVIIGSESGVDRALAIGAGSHDVFTIFSVKASIPHFQIQNNYFNITPSLKLIDIGIYCCDHGHFNSNDTYII